MRFDVDGDWLRGLTGAGRMPVPPHAFALGPERLTYAAFAPVEAGPALAQEVEVPVSPSWFGDGVLGGPLTDESAFAAALESLIGKLVEVPAEASLVLPGEWLRTTYVEVDHVPGKRAERDEVVQWKLRQMVPFRIDDVRLSYAAVPPAGGNGDGNRFLVGFAIDQFLDQLEAAFNAVEIRLGAIVPLSLTLLDALPAGDGFLLWASDRAVSLVSRRDGEPRLLRYKQLKATLPELRERTVRTDLRLSRSWADENGGTVEKVALAVPVEDRERFASWCREDLGAETVEPLDLTARNLPAGSEWRLAPLLGAVSRRVG